MQFCENAGHAVGGITGLVNLANEGHQGLICHSASTRHTLFPVVVAAAGDFEDFAHGAYRKLGLVGGNQRVDGVNVLSPLCANQAVAFARMSRSSSTCLSLRRRAMSSSRSALLNVGAGPDDDLGVAWLTQL